MYDLSYGKDFRVRDCSGNPFVFFLKKTKDWSGKPDPKGHAPHIVIVILYIVVCILSRLLVFQISNSKFQIPNLKFQIPIVEDAQNLKPTT